jgi:hypothetical protein
MELCLHAPICLHGVYSKFTPLYDEVRWTGQKRDAEFWCENLRERDNLQDLGVDYHIRTDVDEIRAST